jgi:putative ABC transport system substrate-binding protein
MRRRDFIAIGGGAALSYPLRVFAQPASGLPLVAVLLPGRPKIYTGFLAALRGGLKDSGFVEGKNFAFAMRFASGNFKRLPSLAAELAALKPRLMVASAVAVPVAHRVAPTVPLVFTAFSADPIALGLAQSYARPGGMVTGNVMHASGGEEGLIGKRIGLFRELVPGFTGLGFIGTASNRVSIMERRGLKKVAGRLGFDVVPLPIRTPDDVKTAVASGLRAGVGAFYISGEPLLFTNRAKVAELVAGSGKPSVGVYPQWARAGLLMSYSTDFVDGFRRAGIYAAKILAGAKPADLPIEQASKFTFAINLRTAKTLGLTVPPTLLLRADEVIE